MVPRRPVVYFPRRHPPQLPQSPLQPPPDLRDLHRDRTARPTMTARASSAMPLPMTASIMTSSGPYNGRRGQGVPLAPVAPAEQKVQNPCQQDHSRRGTQPEGSLSGEQSADLE